MSSAYGWIITKDHLCEPGDTIADETGTIGPRTISNEMKASLIAGKGKAFRLYDDDGEQYYSGRLIGDWQDEEAGFSPLDNFGIPNAGCTEIRYLNPATRKWETL